MNESSPENLKSVEQPSIAKELKNETVTLAEDAPDKKEEIVDEKPIGPEDQVKTTNQEQTQEIAPPIDLQIEKSQGISLEETDSTADTKDASILEVKVSKNSSTEQSIAKELRNETVTLAEDAADKKEEIVDEKLIESEDQVKITSVVQTQEIAPPINLQIEKPQEKVILLEETDSTADTKDASILEDKVIKNSSTEQSIAKELRNENVTLAEDASDKKEEIVVEKPFGPEDQVKITSELQTQEITPPIDLQIEKPQEKTDSSADSKDASILEDEVSKNSSTEQEIIVPEQISVTKPTALRVEGDEVITIKAKEDESKESSKDEYAEHVTYTEDGTAIYTDPKTNYQYKWCSKENNWIPKDTTTSTNPYENEHYKWCNDTQKWIPKQSQVTETEHYKWDADKKQWVAKVKETATAEQTNPTEIVYEIDEDGQRTYTDKDGTVFFWEAEKNAWFPKIDEDFMARYQMSYGFIDNTSESEREKEKRELEAIEQKEKEFAKMVEEAKANEEVAKEAAKQGLKRKQPQEPPKWFEIDPAHNTKVYVSNLPLDITLDEFADVMGKCGMIMRDPQTQKYKLKLYTESDGQVKGDGLCDYIKVESVDLALKILDEYNLRGHKIRVQRAQFQMRGEYNPALKPKRKKKDKEKLAKIKEKLFDWRPEKMRGERSKHEKTVIIKNLFHPELFEKEVQLILDYQNDLREECSKCGTVRKVVIYDRHSEGVAQVNMSSPEEADLVIQMMHGRFFGKRQLTADHWDGKTKYKIEETEEEIQKRLNKWDKYLETEENKKSDLQQDEKDIEKTINFESQPLIETTNVEDILGKAKNQTVPDKGNPEETQKM